jgi:hypothetical protein
MTRVVAFASMLSEPISGSLIDRALASDPAARPTAAAGEGVTAEAIQEAVARVLGVPRAEILSARRTPHVARARQLAMYLCRDLTSASLADIARAFDRDHSTVMYAIRAVDGRIEPGSDTANAIHDVKSALRIGAASPAGPSATAEASPPHSGAAVPRETLIVKPETPTHPHSPTASDTSDPDRKMIGS